MAIDFYITDEDDSKLKSYDNSRHLYFPYKLQSFFINYSGNICSDACSIIKKLDPYNDIVLNNKEIKCLISFCDNTLSYLDDKDFLENIRRYDIKSEKLIQFICTLKNMLIYTIENDKRFYAFGG